MYSVSILMLILIVDRNCIFIVSILYISILVGLYFGAGGLMFEMVWALIVMCWAYNEDFITLEVSTRSG